MKKSLTGKIGVFFLVILVIVTVSVVVSVKTLIKGENINSQIASVNQPSYGLLTRWYYSIELSQLLTNGWVYNPTEDDKVLLRQLVDTIIPEIHNELHVLSKDWHEELKLKYDTLHIQCNQIQEAKKIVMSKLKTYEDYENENIYEELYDVVESDVIKSSKDLMAELEILIGDFENDSSSDKVVLQKSFLNLHIWLYVQLLLVIIVITFAFFITRGIITKPINKLKDIIIRLGKGEIPDNVSIKSNDEIGDMSIALAEMTTNLKNIIEGIKEASGVVYESSKNIDETSKEISDGANNQASASEEVASSMDELSASINHNTENAKGSEAISRQISENIESINSAVNNTMESMRVITDKISIVGDISFQTNILALNAAVEAARAGEHGKGFAVVASEVRKLAESSKIASDEITEVSASGMEVAEKASKELDKLIPEFRKAIDLLQEIGANGQEQSDGMAQVNNTTQQLSNIAQQYAALAQNLSGSSGSLKEQSDALLNIIAFFKLEEK